MSLSTPMRGTLRRMLTAICVKWLHEGWGVKATFLFPAEAGKTDEGARSAGDQSRIRSLPLYPEMPAGMIHSVADQIIRLVAGAKRRSSVALTNEYQMVPRGQGASPRY